MKYLSIVFLTVLLVFAGCAKSTEDLIVGKWSVASVEGGPSGFMKDGQTFDFTKDKTGTMAMPANPNRLGFTYTVDDSKLEIVTPPMGVASQVLLSGTVTIEGDSMTFDVQSGMLAPKGHTPKMIFKRQ